MLFSSKVDNILDAFLPTEIIDEPIHEDADVHQLVEKYNEWIPEPIYKDKNGEPHWLEVQADLLARFQRQFGIEIYLSHENILEGEVWEIMDDYLEDGRLIVINYLKNTRNGKFFQVLIMLLEVQTNIKC